MDRKDISFRNWLIAFNEGKFKAKDTDTQIAAGWYDWFCNDESLAGKTVTLGRKAKKLAGSPKLNLDTMYVWFKNNCPMCGRLYDDIRFADMKTGDVIFTITPSSGHDSDRGEASVWGRENDFKEALVKGTWEDVLNFFGVK